MLYKPGLGQGHAVKKDTSMLVRLTKGNYFASSKGLD
jgi:hypothetical protein